mgnify:FL=1
MSTAGMVVPGPAIPGFRFVRPLGMGGFADVYLYHQALPSRDVAIKIVRAQGDARGTEELHREADAMTLLAGHPAVVELHGVGTTSDGRAYLVMEYCPVADVLSQVRAKPMALDRALDFMIQICGGVEVFHRQGYVHRDIKPSNIMLDAYGQPVLADFGVASPKGELEVGAFDGFSVLWAPPEQQDASNPATPQQDVWALASTTWTLVTGRSPFEDPIGDNSAASIAMRVQRGRIRSLGRADAPPELEEVLRAALDIDPDKRTPTAQAFGEGLQSVQRAMGLPVTKMEVKESKTNAVFGLTSDAIDAKTRLRGAVRIDPEGTRMRALKYDFGDQVPAAPVADSWEVERADGAEAAPESAKKQEEPERSKRTPFATILVLFLVGALVTAGLITAILTQQGTVNRVPGTETPSTGSETADPVGQPPPVVTGLAGDYADGTITWTWSAPENTSSTTVEYSYAATGPDGDKNGTTEGTTVTLPAASGRNCVDIATVAVVTRRASDPIRACVDVP